ncbi:hypothetical protein [Sinomicrobium sp. M5D2P9]
MIYITWGYLTLKQKTGTLRNISVKYIVDTVYGLFHQSISRYGISMDNAFP